MTKRRSLVLLLLLGAVLRPSTGSADTLMLVCQSSAEGASARPPASALMTFQIDLERNTIAYLDEDATTVVWRIAAEVTEGYIRWRGYMPEWPATLRAGNGTPVTDLSSGRFDNEMHSISGSINRTSGRINDAIVLWFPSAGRYRVDYLSAGVCRRGTQKF